VASFRGCGHSRINVISTQFFTQFSQT
jgi:hypothetical protein